MQINFLSFNLSKVGSSYTNLQCKKAKQPERNSKYIVWRKKNMSKIIVLAKAYTKTHYNLKEIIACNERSPAHI